MARLNCLIIILTSLYLGDAYLSVGRGRPVLLGPRRPEESEGRRGPFPPEPEQLPGPPSPHPARSGRLGGAAMSSTPVTIGIDVAKAHLDVAVPPGGEQWQVSNDEDGIHALLARLQPLQPRLIVLEAS